MNSGFTMWGVAELLHGRGGVTDPFSSAWAMITVDRFVALEAGD